MKILFVSSYYLPYVSGLTIHAQRLAEGLVKRKYSCTIITNNHTGKLKSEETIGGVKVVRANPLFRLSRGFISFSIVSLFITYCRENDRVVLHLPMAEAFLFALIAKIYRKKILLIYHANLNLPSWLISSRFIETLVLVNHIFAGLLASKIVAYSQDYADYAFLLRLFKRKIKVVSPPVIVNSPSLKLVQSLRRKYNLNNKKVIGFAGRFAEEKGGDLLIECLPKLIDTNKEIVLVFAGEANLAYENFYIRKKQLIDKYKKNIVFIGLIPPEKIANFYKLCDVLALPSRAECFGLVQAEAMLCGVPVVAFDIPGGRVPIKLTGMGLLAKPYNVIDFATKIIETITQRNKYVIDPIRVREIFSIEKTLNQYEETIKK